MKTLRLFILSILILIVPISYIISQQKPQSDKLSPEFDNSNKIIIDYVIITSKDIGDLNLKVKNFIRMGYQPYGFITTTLEDNYNSSYTVPIYIQIVVKYE